ncbi:hypothetical protein C8F01DRAFT_1246080 [Mycena amicta]|nr:hypothetical protein C8F01DRAFT_1246080 [Mycena amicta]
MSVNKLAADRNQKILLELAALPGNDVCADCKVKNPRWASYSLGIFICVNCASIHRKIGTHVSKVKSLTMDSWTKEQIDRMREMGNVNSNLIHNANETRHPPPPNLLDGERDSEMEQYVRSKYEYKSFIDRSALVASKLGPSRSLSSIAPRPSNGGVSSSSTKAPPPRSNTVAPEPPKVAPSRSYSQPLASSSTPAPRPQPPTQQPPPPQQPGGVWDDLISLQTPAVNSSLPLQVQANPNPAFLQPQRQLVTGFPRMAPTPTGMSMSMQFVPSFAPQPIPMQLHQPQYTSAQSPPILYNPQPQPFGVQQPVYGSPGPMQMTPSPVPMHTPSPGIGMQQPQFGQPQPHMFVPQQQQQQFGGVGMGFTTQQQMQFMPPHMGGGAPQHMGSPMPTGQPWMGYPQQQGQWGAM